MKLLLGEVGGYMGLLLGGSVITLLEVIDLFIYNLFLRITTQRKRVRTAPLTDGPKPTICYVHEIKSGQDEKSA